MTVEAGNLEAQASEFADQMTELLMDTVSSDVSIRPCRVDMEDGAEVYFVGNGLPDQAPATAVAHLRGDDIPVVRPEGVFVGASWRFIANTSGQWIKVDWSSFSLMCTNAKGQRSPLFRMEVDPHKEGWSRAHMHITAESMLLGHVYGLQNLPYKRIGSIHIPVGGFAFRPCLEDLIEFAVDEGLISPIHEERWRSAVNKHRAEYHRRQLMSLVGKDPDTAADALRRLGYAVEA